MLLLLLLLLLMLLLGLDYLNESVRPQARAFLCDAAATTLSNIVGGRGSQNSWLHRDTITTITGRKLRKNIMLSYFQFGYRCYRRRQLAMRQEGWISNKGLFRSIFS